MSITKKGLSLYVHIPFCVQKCLYCDFLSAPAGDSVKEEYVQLLCQEITNWGEQLREEYHLQTIFLGGGTPSCLSPRQLLLLGETIQTAFETENGLEYTTEANPGTVTKEHAAAFRQMGINRVSLGLQSAQDTELQRLGRIHDYRQFLETYERLRESGIENINIDLMADIPGQTLASYQDTLTKVVALQPEHISAYSLIIEEGTPFYEMEQKGCLESADEDTDREMYTFTGEYLAQQGWNRYEISNYARPGKQCRHNCTYWQGGEYLGTGLGASSYLSQYRFSNPVEMKAYRQYVTGMGGRNWKEYAFPEITLLSKKMQMEEFCFLGLRMQQGISRAEFEKRFGVSVNQVYSAVLPRLYEQGLLAESQFHDRIYLTNRGIDISNRVLAEFLLDDSQNCCG